MATNKVTLVAALLVALVAVTTATTYTTTITTTTVEDERSQREQQQQQQQCQLQLQGRQFQSCQAHLTQRSRSPYMDEEDVLELTTGQSGQQQQAQILKDCCQQLQNVNEQCRCEAIRQTLRQVQQGQQQQPGQSQTQKVYERATDLPRRCNMRPQQCQIRVVFV